MSNAVMSDWPSGVANTGWPSEPSGMFMPGRIQGWPAGTQRAANAAQRLLSQAVAWWDVEQYRDGDRFLRNRGTGGELLDLRLGSSIAPNSNDPLYLPTADDGYIYLSGVAGNSLSITAPATATQYIAYPLDRSASTATGAVTGGATFTFSTAGSWRLIELLDASNVVVDTIDCDVIASGSATSFLSGIVNQTVTVNRSTSGRKSVAVPSRHKGGKPVMLLGTDDYLTCVDNWQHGLLNFGQGDSFTVVIVGRQWGTTTAPKLICKAFSSGAGWEVYRPNGSTTQRSFVVDSDVRFTEATTSITSGVAHTLTSLIDRTNRTVQAWTDATKGTAVSIATVRSLSNQASLRIGSNAENVGFANFEFYGGAIFRRLLADPEIITVSREMTRRIA